MTRTQIETLVEQNGRHGISVVAVWDYQPGILFIKYSAIGMAQIDGGGKLQRLRQWPDESLGAVHDVTHEVLRS